MRTDQMCVWGVMDTTAEDITFDANRVCSLYHHFKESLKPALDRGGHSEEGKKHLDQVVGAIKRTGYESALTRFFQGCYLLTKLGIDKCKAHLSSLILSGQITREKALEGLKKPPYPSEEQLQADNAYIAQRLGLTEWEEILALPCWKHEEFPSSESLFALKNRLVTLTGIRRRRYGL